jgi:type II secretory pathway pseudopilin PulG
VAPAADGVSELLSPELMVIVGAIVLAIVLSGAFYVVLRAMDALKVSVPQEVTTAFGNQLIELINQSRQYVHTKAKETTTPIDDAFAALADIPLDALENEIRRRSNPPVISG